MPSDKELSIKLGADPSQLEAGLTRAKTAVKSWANESQDSIAAVEQSTEKMARLWRSAFEAFIGFEVINQLKGIALAAEDAQKSLAIATVTAANFGHVFDANKMEDWLERFSKSAQSGGASMIELRSAAQKFASIGQDQNQIQRAIADSAQLAAAKNMDLAEATRVVQFALQGHVALLTRYGIITMEQAKHITTTEQAMEALEKATKGAAEAQSALNPAAAFSRLGNALDDFRDKVGTSLQKPMADIANAGVHLVDILEKIPAPVLAFAAKVATATGALVALVLLLPAAWKALELVGEGLKLVGGLVTWVIPLFDLLATSFEAVMAGELGMAAGFALAALGPVLVGAAIVALIAVIATFATDLTDTKEFFISVWAIMGDEVRRFVAQFKALIAPVVGYIQDVVVLASSLWSSMVDFFGETWKGVCATFGPTFSSAMSQVSSALSPVATAWDKFCGFLTDRFQSFLDKLHLQVAQVQNVLGGIVGGGALLGPLGALLGGIRGTEKPDTKEQNDQRRAVGALGGEWAHFKDGLKAAVDGLKHLTDSTLGKNVNVPKDAFKNTVVPPKTTGHSSQAAENALKNFEDAIKARLDVIQQEVDKAKSRLDTAKERLTQFDTAHPSDQPISPQDEANRHKLVNDQLYQETRYRATLLIQQAAQKTAQEQLIRYAETITAHLKNHDQLERQVRDAAMQHAKAARDIGLAYIQAGTELAKLVAAEKARDVQRADQARDEQEDLANMQLEVQKLAANANIEAVQSALSMLGQGGGGGVSWTRPPTQSGKNYNEALDQAKKVTAGGGKTPSLEEDRLKIALAELTLGVDQDTLETKKHIEAIAKETYERTGSMNDLKAWQTAIEGTITAMQAVTKGTDDLNAAQQKFIADQNAAWTQLITGLISKANAPGLGYNQQTQQLSFDPMQMLFSALEQTQMFGDVMNTVTQIVQTFAQILNALRPVIDALLMVIRAVANVFIFLYNMVARLIDLMGAQLQQMQYLTDAMGGLVPLIQIWHEIPTLNELAAGKLNSPLSTTPTGNNTLGQSNGGQNTLMRVVEVLTGILAAVMLTKVLSGMSLAKAEQQTLQLIGIHTTGTSRNAQAAAQHAQDVADINKGQVQQFGQLQQVITLLTQIAASGSMGGGGLLSAFGVGSLGGGLPGGGIGLGWGDFAAGMAKTVGGGGGGLSQMAEKITKVTLALGAHESQVNSSAGSMARLTDNLLSLAAAVQSADRSISITTKTDINNPTLNNKLDLDDLSNAIAKNTDRAFQSASYGIDRAPIQ